MSRCALSGALTLKHFAASSSRLCKLDSGKIKQEQKKIQDLCSYTGCEGHGGTPEEVSGSESVRYCRRLSSSWKDSYKIVKPFIK